MSEPETPLSSPNSQISDAPEATAAPTDTAPTAAAAAAGAPAGGEALEAAIVEALESVYDPEIPVNIYELGLIYDIDIQAGNQVAVKMTLTSPACPVAGSLPGEVRDKVLGVLGVADAEVEVVWDPVWNPSMMSEAAKLQLGML